MNPLNQENYTQGFLVDEELMAGVTQDTDRPEAFAAFILRHTTGEYLGYRLFHDLEAALHAINHIPRDWTFERFGGCGGGCKTGGSCGGGNCKKGACAIGGC